MPTLEGQRGRWLLAVLVVVQVSATAAIGWRAGTHIEEVGGLLEVAPQRLGTGAAAAPSGHGAWRLRASQHLPVWGLERGADGFTPLMVDGHLGGVAFVLHRLARTLGGLRLARALSWLFAGLLLVGIWLLGRELGGPAVAWLAALLAALSPHVAFMHHWARPDEQFSAGLPVFAVLALIRQRRTASAHWLVVAVALLGLAMAAKNTAAWVVLALLLTGWLLHAWPRCAPMTWALAAAAAALPLLPQLAYVLIGRDSEAFWQRLATLPGPEALLNPRRLIFFVDHFAVSFGALGDYIGQLTGAGPAAPAAWAVATGGLALFALVALPVVAMRAGTTRPVRLFGCGLGLALLQYVALYYEGMSLFGLLGPWVPLALAVALVSFSRWLAQRGLAPWAARTLLAVLIAALALTQVAQQFRLQAAFDGPRHGIFELAAQERLVEAARRHSDGMVWTTTYDLAGVPELLSKGQLQARHLFPIFWDVVSSAEETPALYDAAWRRALDHLPPGRHVLILVPRPADIEVSPCRHGAWIAERLPMVAAARGLATTRLAEIDLSGDAVAYGLHEIVIP